MKLRRDQPLTGWGRSSATRSTVLQPEGQADVQVALDSLGSNGLIARGFGRSYGDACLNDRGHVLDMRALKDIRSMCGDTGVIDVAAGLSFRELMQYCIPKGWLPPACPGTAFVSMGGAVAHDVHGKNQEAVGSFGDHLIDFDMVRPDGNVQRVSAASDPTLFEATLGGLGLTGLLLSVRLQLRRIPSNAMELTEQRYDCLDEFLQRLADPHDDWEYSVGWIDALKRGPKMGRGIVERARHANRSVGDGGTRELSMPFDLPGWVLNAASVGAFNSWYFHRIPRAGRTRLVHVNRFLYPLDALQDWNRMYGRKGVLQFQAAFPPANGREALHRIIDRATTHRGASFLAVVKTMGRHGNGMLSFPMPGFSIALDFPRRRETMGLFRDLHDITLEYGGRVYLAKDAVLSPSELVQMYPQVGRFRSTLATLDPTGRMQSDMSRRLGLAPPSAS